MTIQAPWDFAFYCLYSCEREESVSCVSEKNVFVEVEPSEAGGAREREREREREGERERERQRKKERKKERKNERKK